MKFPPVLFFFPAGLEEGKEFFGASWPEARAVSDEEGVFYQGFGVSKASLRQIFGPGVWVRALKAMKEGYSVGRVIGNPWLLPGILLVRGEQVLWSWKFQNVGSYPDFAQLSRLVESFE